MLSISHQLTTLVTGACVGVTGELRSTWRCGYGDGRVAAGARSHSDAWLGCTV
jgi:hypothetical protein